MPFPWRWTGGTISTNLDVIWGSHRIGATKDIERIIECCFLDGDFHVVGVPIDYSDSKSVLIDELYGAGSERISNARP